MTTESWTDENVTYRCVFNDEHAYSIWPADKQLPAGWQDAGKQGSRQECLDYIETVWTDMRPLSLRRAMAGAEEPEGLADQ